MAEILIYGDIGENFWEPENSITAKTVAVDLAAVPTSDKILDVRINTFGGQANEGLAIRNQLRTFASKRRMFQSDFQVRGIVDGYAYSAGSVILMGCDKRIMNKGTMAMIHRAWSFCMGNVFDMRSNAEYLDKLDGELAKIYASVTKQKEDDVMALLTAETYFNPEEALALGLIDEIDTQYVANFGDYTDAFTKLDNGDWVKTMTQRHMRNVQKREAAVRGGGKQTGTVTAPDTDWIGEAEAQSRIDRLAL